MDCLCIADFNGYFKKINPAFVELLGYSEEELKSKKIYEFIYEDDKERTASMRDQLTKDVPLVNFENRYVSKSGEIVWLHWTSIPVPEEQLVYAIARDISYYKGLENERVSHLSQLAKVNEELKKLSYLTSHDLRSPVNNLISMTELIDPTKINDEDTLQVINYIKISAQTLKNSLNAFVDLLKQKEVPDKKLEKVYFAEIFDRVSLSVRSLIKKSRATFYLDFEEAAFVNYNTAYLESIFLNLFTNSIKYAKPGIPPIITIKTTKGTDEIVLTYSDNGIGFDMDEVGHQIFTLKQKTNPNKDSKGVGLYLVHNHVTSLGGSISVESAVNEGTTFTIKFPV
ncbi:PAS domain-containing sensor histidine kinase [Pseudozobellia thermophila]|nr:PAS domain-containing sensor histidine kinase [Pseudozobellia thermophila]